MADNTRRQKVRELAQKIQGRQLTLNEAARLDQAVDRKGRLQLPEVEEVLAEGLQKSAQEIHRELASHDDSRRIIDEIIRALDK